VADAETSYIGEDYLPERKEFFDDYSRTKYIAEKMVREFGSLNASLPLRVIRPGIIVGDSKTGFIGSINGPYYFLDLVKKNINIIKKLPIVPLAFNPESELHIIPVDHVANLISKIISRDNFDSGSKSYHLISIDPPKVKDFLEDTRQALGLKCHFIPLQRHKAFNFILPLLKIPKEVIPFMFSKISYDKLATLKDLPELKESKYADYKKIFF
jgi:thioester reductase-like protein